MAKQTPESKKEMLERLAAANNPSSAAVAKALEAAKAAEEERQVEQMIDHLSTLDQSEKDAYEDYLKAKKRAEVKLKYLKSVSESKRKFEKDGDIKASNKRLTAAFEKRYSRLERL